MRVHGSSLVAREGSDERTVLTRPGGWSCVHHDGRWTFAVSARGGEVDVLDRSGGRATRIARWALPAPWDGAWTGVATWIPDDAMADGTLFLVGHDPAVGNALVSVPWVQGVLGSPTRVEEYFGETAWTSVRSVPPGRPTHVAVDAGERGVLRFALPLDEGAEPVEDGGQP